jgi:hypothetical protein
MGFNLASKEQVWVWVADNWPFIISSRHPLEEKN